MKKVKKTKKNQMNFLGVFALLVIGLVLAGGLVSAYRGDYSVKGPNYTEERESAMEDAFDSLDYDAWVALMSEDGRHPRVLDVVNEDNFDVFVEARSAALSGDQETADELRAELGLGQGLGAHGRGSGMHSGSHTGYGRGRY